MSKWRTADWQRQERYHWMATPSIPPPRTVRRLQRTYYALALLYTSQVNAGNAAASDTWRRITTLRDNLVRLGVDVPAFAARHQ